MKRPVITGYGCVAPPLRSQGDGIPAALLADAAFQLRGEYEPGFIRNFHPEKYIAETQLRRFDRFSQMATTAAKKAIQSAQLNITAEIADRAGVIMSTCFGPFQTITKYMTTLADHGIKRAPAGLYPFTVYNAFTGLLTCEIKALGTNSTLSNCSSFACGVNAIEQGTDDIMIVGGCDELSPEILHTLSMSPSDHRNKMLDTNTAGGLVLSEGAAVVVLEEISFSHARSAHVLAEVVSYGFVNSITDSRIPYDDIDMHSIETAMRQALALGNLRPSDVDIVMCGANGSPNLESCEANAVRIVFSDDEMPRIFNAKHFIGETMGAASTFSIIIAALNLEALCTAPETAASTGWRYALVNCYEMGGNTVSVLLRASNQKTWS